MTDISLSECVSFIGNKCVMTKTSTGGNDSGCFASFWQHWQLYMSRFYELILQFNPSVHFKMCQLSAYLYGQIPLMPGWTQMGSTLHQGKGYSKFYILLPCCEGNGRFLALSGE